MPQAFGYLASGVRWTAVVVGGLFTCVKCAAWCAGVVAVAGMLGGCAATDSVQQRADGQWPAVYPLAADDASVDAVTPRQVSVPAAVSPFGYVGATVQFDAADAGKVVAPRILVAAVSPSNASVDSSADVVVTTQAGYSPADVANSVTVAAAGAWTWSHPSSAAVFPLPKLVIPDDGRVAVKLEINTPAYFLNGAVIAADSGPDSAQSQWTWFGVAPAGIAAATAPHVFTVANDRLPQQFRDPVVNAAPVTGWGSSMSDWVSDPSTVTLAPLPAADVKSRSTRTMFAALTAMGIAAVTHAQYVPKSSHLDGVDASHCVLTASPVCVVTTEVTAPANVDMTAHDVSFVLYPATKGDTNVATKDWQATATVAGAPAPVHVAGHGPVTVTLAEPVVVPAGGKVDVVWTIRHSGGVPDELPGQFLQTVNGATSASGVQVDCLTGVVVSLAGGPGIVTDLDLHNWLVSIGQADKWGAIIDGRDTP